MWLLLGVALGAEPDTRTITTLLVDLAEQTGSTVLVGTAGPEAAKALEKIQAEHGELALKVVSVPTLGDAEAEMTKVLTSTALRCGVRVGLDPVDASWALSTHGACDEVDDSKESRAAPGGLSYEQKVAALATYHAKALERRRPSERITANPMVTGSASTVLPWQVWDGTDHVLTTRAFAEAIQDQATLDELAADAQAARKRRNALLIAGPLAVAGGLALTLGVQPFDLAVSPIGSQAHRGEALTHDLLTVGASVLVAGGAGAIGLGLVQVPLADIRASKVHKYYSSSEADKRIESHNGDVLFDLGLRSSDLRYPPEVPPPESLNLGAGSAGSGPASGASTPPPATPAPAPAPATPAPATPAPKP